MMFLDERTTVKRNSDEENKSRFVDNLSYSILRFCKSRKISQLSFALQCDLSGRYMSAICCRCTAASIATLEKLCKTTHLTPNDLLLSSKENLLAYSFPMEITVLRRCPKSETYKPLCPRCFSMLEKKHLPSCTHCGQALAWNQLHNATILETAVSDSD